ncbi:hypothetical protein HPB51_004681 [Rhipicephalus microplus]|uniref:Uncharacterized protein n=1 Tax=Rhipicephalus microplus TaxID=6941 RepID=A0A9J6DZN1_RHIMP|nr:hypothetical protein HPB51_004681 [Rhipicephalus microplus]
MSREENGRRLLLSRTLVEPFWVTCHPGPRSRNASKKQTLAGLPMDNISVNDDTAIPLTYYAVASTSATNTAQGGRTPRQPDYWAPEGRIFSGKNKEDVDSWLKHYDRVMATPGCLHIDAAADLRLSSTRPLPEDYYASPGNVPAEHDLSLPTSATSPPATPAACAATFFDVPGSYARNACAAAFFDIPASCTRNLDRSPGGQPSPTPVA